MLSVIYRIFLILIIINVQAAIAQERSTYRVELLVLRHLDATADPTIVAELPNLPRKALDLQPSDTADSPHRLLPDDPISPAPPDNALLPPVGPFPDEIPFAEVAAIETRSERMNAVWRNLRLSESFRPEAYLAWEQPVEGPFPLVRVRNEEVIAIDDPYASIRALEPPYLFQYDPESAELALRPVPEPHVHYALEGVVRLRRSRFLHFDVDLAVRRPATPFSAGAAIVHAGPPLLLEHFGYEVNVLIQSRQVRTERMEYFDSPVLGVLLWITEIKYAEETAADAGDIAP